MAYGFNDDKSKVEVYEKTETYSKTEINNKLSGTRKYTLLSSDYSLPAGTTASYINSNSKYDAFEFTFTYHDGCLHTVIVPKGQRRISASDVLSVYKNSQTSEYTITSFPFGFFDVDTTYSNDQFLKLSNSSDKAFTLVRIYGIEYVS